MGGLKIISTEHVIEYGAGPYISDNKVIWADNKSGNLNIYLYDFSKDKKIQITKNLKNLQTDFDISNDKIVWYDNESIYLYDLSTNEETQLIQISPPRFGPYIDEDKIIWVPSSPLTYTYLHLYNLSSGEERQLIKILSEWMSSFKISDNKIVWSDSRNGNIYGDNHDIYLYDLSTNEEKPITDDSLSHRNPVIDKDKIVWSESHYIEGLGGGTVSKVSTYLYDLSTDEQKLILENISYSVFSFDISKNKIVLGGYDNDIHIYFLD